MQIDITRPNPLPTLPRSTEGGSKGRPNRALHPDPNTPPGLRLQSGGGSTTLPRLITAAACAAQTLFGIAALIAPVVGPTLGGWITDHYQWRWSQFFPPKIDVMPSL